MKAVLALIAIYVVAFIIATQGASQNPVQASAPDSEIIAAAKSIDPAKQADIRSLLEFLGAKDQLQAAVSDSSAQYRDKLLSSTAKLPDDSQRQALITGASATVLPLISRKISIASAPCSKLQASTTNTTAMTK